jgi:magnesium transporter
VLPDIHALRRDVALLRRVLGPQRRTLDVLARTGVDLTDRSRRDLSDAIDHHGRLVESLDAAHQMVSTVLDTYRGAAAERMNEVMKVLTVISTIFIPLTFIAGVYGMNFKHMPELDQSWAYPAAMGLMLSIALGMIIFFKRKKWF